MGAELSKWSDMLIGDFSVQIRQNRNEESLTVKLEKRLGQFLTTNPEAILILELLRECIDSNSVKSHFFGERNKNRKRDLLSLDNKKIEMLMDIFDLRSVSLRFWQMLYFLVQSKRNDGYLNMIREVEQEPSLDQGTRLSPCPSSHSGLLIKPAVSTNESERPLHKVPSQSKQIKKVDFGTYEFLSKDLVNGKNLTDSTQVEVLENYRDHNDEKKKKGKKEEALKQGKQEESIGMHLRKLIPQKAEVGDLEKSHERNRNKRELERWQRFGPDKENAPNHSGMANERKSWNIGPESQAAHKPCQGEHGERPANKQIKVILVERSQKGSSSSKREALRAVKGLEEQQRAREVRHLFQNQQLKLKIEKKLSFGDLSSED
jgi:hypothetical protein